MSGTEPDTVILTYREEGEIDRRRLSGILGAATTLLMLLLIVALSLGAIGAVGVGIGGFVIEFSDVSAASGAVYPALGQQSECDSAPQLMATLDGEAEIDGYFQITKGIPVPGETVGGISVDILSEAGENDSITADSLDLHLTALSSQELVLGETTIAEAGPADGEESAEDLYTDAEEVSETDAEDIRTGFSVDAGGGFGVIGGRAVVYQIAFDNIQIGGIGVSGSTYQAGNATTAMSYDCDELEPVAVDEDGNFTLPNEGNVTVNRDMMLVHGEDTEMQDDETEEAADETNQTDEQDETALQGQPELDVLSVEPPPGADIEIGDEITVQVAVTNVGNATETWTVYAEADQDGESVVVDSRTVTLDVGDSDTLSFSYEAGESDVPEASVTLEVDEPA